MKFCYVLGENPIDSEADRQRTVRLMSSLEFLVVQDLFYTKTAQLADVVLPGSAGWCETDGTVTNSERRVQRVRAAVPMPPGVRNDIEVIFEIARRMGRDLGCAEAECIWDELRKLSPMHAGMSYKRLEETGGIQWPCYDENHPGELFLHSRLWREPLLGPRTPFHAVEFEPPVDQLNEEFPLRLTTGSPPRFLQHRRADQRQYKQLAVAPSRSSGPRPRRWPALPRSRGGEGVGFVAPRLGSGSRAPRSRIAPGPRFPSRFTSTSRWPPTPSRLTP